MSAVGVVISASHKSAMEVHIGMFHPDANRVILSFEERV